MPAEEVCREWSLTADGLVKEAFEHCFNGCHVALFALGKLGSNELNLSSDIDILIISKDESSISLSALRRFQKILGERTIHGFVFRIDFDLRPGGKQGPLIPTVDQFNDYYGNYGETWERLAFVRLRPICGDATIHEDILKFAQKFSYRRHLDFTLLEDLKNLRSKIQTHYWARSQKDVIDLKLGVGGIRDVELFTHALQVIHGGRDHSLQVRETTIALKLLAEKKLLPSEEANFLVTHYWNLRALENYVQALNDEQTHLLLLNGQHPDFVKQALVNLQNQMKRCDHIVKSLLGEAPEELPLEQKLQEIGFSEAELDELWNEILGKEVLSHNKTRDETARKGFLLEFIQTLQQQKGDVKRALLLLKDFVRGTRAKSSFFTMLVREKELLKELTWLFGYSPYLSKILCSRPELLDSFVYRSQDKPAVDLGTLLDELAEKKLLSEIINGSQYLKDKNLSALISNLSSTADSIAETLLQALKKEYPSDVQILALGKWGGREIGFRSDLDFIFVVKNSPSEVDFKLAKRFITRLTEAHRGGNIYSIDMRLRPSGKAGPLVIQEKDFVNYLEQEAQAWERQAYLKSRVLGDDRFSFAKYFIDRGLINAELADLETIRKKLLSSESQATNLKFSEGGLVDVELALQTQLLINKTIPPSPNTFDFFPALSPKGEILRDNYERLRQIEQMLQLVASESLSELVPNHECFQTLALVLQTTPKFLVEEVSDLMKTNITLLKDLDPRRQAI